MLPRHPARSELVWRARARWAICRTGKPPIHEHSRGLAPVRSAALVVTADLQADPEASRAWRGPGSASGTTLAKDTIASSLRASKARMRKARS